MNNKIINLLPALAISLFNANASADIIDDMAVNSWIQAPNTKMQDVCPSGANCGAIINAWGGGALDTSKNQMYIWGGGHGDYDGNEVYRFDIDSFSWERLTDPSSTDGWSWSSHGKKLPDGTPTSRHSNDGLEFIPSPVNKFITMTGDVWPNGYASSDSWLFDPETKEWEYLGSLSAAGSYSTAYSAYDPVTGFVWFNGHKALAHFDPSSKQWINNNAYDVGTRRGGSMAIAPSRRLLVAYGRGNIWSWDVTNPDSTSIDREAVSVSGDTTIIDANYPGNAFDPVLDRFVGWAGGSDVYLLNPDSWVWQKVSTNGSYPSEQARNGTFGRLAYIPTKNAFILVNDVDQDVYFLKLSDGQVISPPEKPQGVRVDVSQ